MLLPTCFKHLYLKVLWENMHAFLGKLGLTSSVRKGKFDPMAKDFISLLYPLVFLSCITDLQCDCITSGHMHQCSHIKSWVCRGFVKVKLSWKGMVPLGRRLERLSCSLSAISGSNEKKWQPAAQKSILTSPCSCLPKSHVYLPEWHFTAYRIALWFCFLNESFH